MILLTIEQDGFFEGVYDHDFEARADLNQQQLNDAMPHHSRWDAGYARPVLFEFPKGVEQHLGGLTLYQQTNQLVQIGLQYHRSLEDRTPVPDGYMVRYSRLGRRGSADIDKSLIVAVLRTEVADELIGADLSNAYDTDRSWQEIAQQGQRFGNAVLAFSTSKRSYKSLFSRTSKRHASPTQPADLKLAQAVFETVAFWEA